jgi:hypothetical protein
MRIVAGAHRGNGAVDMGSHAGQQSSEMHAPLLIFSLLLKTPAKTLAKKSVVEFFLKKNSISSVSGWRHG